MKMNGRVYLNLLAVASLFIALNSPAAPGDDAVVQFERFTTKEELAPENLLVLPKEEFLEEYQNFSLPGDLERLRENGGGEKSQSRVRLNFSRFVAAGERVDPFEQDRINKWSMLKSLPETLQNADSTQERFETFGKIFEPKVSLEFHF